MKIAKHNHRYPRESHYVIKQTSRNQDVSIKVHEYAWSVTSDFCDPVDHNPPGSAVHGIFQSRILE